MKSFFLRWLFYTLVLLNCPFSPLKGQVIFVDFSADGNNSGESWENAYTDLKMALDQSPAGEIWIAEGLYSPSFPEGSNTESFSLRDGHILYGGFSGSETQIEERNPTEYVTILSGITNPADVFNLIGSSYHVLTASSGGAIFLDGFTIQMGRASRSAGVHGFGGGLYSNEANITIRDCRFVDNFAHSGAAIYFYGGQLNISHCEFKRNTAQHYGGGGLSISGGAQVEIVDSVFEGNVARGGVGNNNGGAINIDFATGSTTIRRCSFYSNTALNTTHSRSSYGGAIAHFGGTLEVYDCRIGRNLSKLGGGISSWSESLFVNCLIYNNEVIAGGGEIDSGGLGGGVYVRAGSGKNNRFVNCVIYKNKADDGGGVVNGSDDRLKIENSILWANKHNSGQNQQQQFKGRSGGVLIHCCVQDLFVPEPGEDIPEPKKYPGSFDLDPLFFNIEGADGILGTLDDDFQLSVDSPCIDRGKNSALPAGVLKDYLGNQRLQDEPTVTDLGSGSSPLVDIGAYEYTSPVPIELSLTGGSRGTTSREIPVEILTSESVTRMRLRIDGQAWGEWKNFRFESQLTLPDLDEHYKVYCQVGDDLGNVFAETNSSIRLDRQGPIGLIQINSKDRETSDSAIQIIFTVFDPSGTSDMRVQENGGEWSDWIPYKQLYVWSLHGLPNGETEIKVQFRDALGQESGIYSDSVTINKPLPPSFFLRGDADNDGFLTIGDPIFTLFVLYRPDFQSPQCWRALDSNSDGLADLSDALYSLNFIFMEGPAIAEPFPDCGIDFSVGEALTCTNSICP